jgi:putative transposase
MWRTQISYRQLEEMMEERGVGVDHSGLNRWVLKYVPLLDKAFRARKRRVGDSWRMGCEEERPQ